MSHHVRIKICGISEETTLQAAIEAGADYIGFVHFEKSPRSVEPEMAIELASMIPEGIEPVGLFVNAPLDEMLAWPHEWIQLHGDEDEEIAELLKAEGRRVIRGFHFDPQEVARWDRCEAVDRLLLDGSSLGGSGQSFDHRALDRLDDPVQTPVLVAGGLTPENVTTALENCRPWGVDVSSGVESSRGVKDTERIKAFCSAVRGAGN
jgi:phosphoribosylanthranilate isomerase